MNSRKIRSLKIIRSFSILITFLFILIIFLITSRAKSGIAAYPGANGKIAFTLTGLGNLDIYVINPDGTGAINLTDDIARDEDPAWSPDGTKIAFASTRHGYAETQIFLMNADGSNISQLTHVQLPEPGPKFSPTWSPDGTKIAFSLSSSAANNYEISVIDIDGNNLTNLTNNPATDFRPNWSPDGSKIAFTSNRNGNLEIWVMDSDGSNPANLSNNPTDDMFPNWSPDGSHIIFNSFRNETTDVFVMNADGSDQTNLTNRDGEDSGPAWSPDGTKIVFTSNRPEGNSGLFIMNEDGTCPTRLTEAGLSSRNDIQADWQPIISQLTPYTNTVYLPYLSQNIDLSQIFVDDFSDIGSRWFCDDNGNIKWSYQLADGEYEILLRNQFWWGAVVGLFGGLPGSFSVEADIRTADSNSGEIGLIFSWVDWNQYYAFLIDPALQSFSIQRFDFPSWTPIIPWTSSVFANPGHSTNHLKLERDGSNITAFINGEQVAAAVDGTYFGSLGVGLYIESDMDVPVAARFDNFQIYGLETGPTAQSNLIPNQFTLFDHSGDHLDLVPRDHR